MRSKKLLPDPENMVSRDIEKYAHEYMTDYGFERVMVKYRRRLVLERVRAVNPQTVIEVGCGSELLYEYYLRESAPVNMWVIVEPAPDFARQAREADLPNAIVAEGTLEASVDKLRSLFGKNAPHLIICSAVLNEVNDADALIASMASLMDGRTILHANVPNANSFHRRLALAMGLISRLTEFTERNRTLQQHRVYGAQTLVRDIERAGLRVLETGGHFIKPFTHKQMEHISSVAGEEILDGLYVLGRQHPEWSSEIFAEAKLA
jgi:trans-aconitate methyltransferase